MDDIYKTLLDDMKTLRNAEEVDCCGMDDFIESSQHGLPDTLKVASIGDLKDFLRIAENTLVHKAERDLWRINESKSGDVVIERLFDPETKEPIRV